MNEKEFMEKAEIINAENAGKRTGFWFSIDFIDFRLVNHCYGMEKGTELLTRTEKFFGGLESVRLFRRVYANQFLFAAEKPRSYTDEEIIEAWEKKSGEFLSGCQEDFPLCNLKICCGIAPMDENGAKAAIDNAIMARKQSRDSVGNKAVVYNSVFLERLMERHEKKNQIASAFDEKRFTYYLQPIVDLQTGRIIGAEALVRQISPEGKLIYPDDFLPIMERDGTVVELDFLILRQVCQDLAQRLERGLPVVPTAVNLSRRHIQEKDTVAKIDGITAEYGLAHGLFDFELTETIPLDETGGASNILNGLRDRGYRVSVDDYGSGYTGVSVWQDLEFDSLKMDKKFLDEDAGLRRKSAVIISHTIDMADKMGVNVICEGLEKSEQYERLLNYGCKTAQGFYFSPAVPPEEFYEFYEKSDGFYPTPVA